MTQADLELIKGSRYQRIFPKGYFLQRRHDESFKKAIDDIDDHYDQIFRTTYNYETTAEKLMKYNNTRLQYLLKLYYQRRSEQGIHYIRHV